MSVNIVAVMNTLRLCSHVRLEVSEVIHEVCLHNSPGTVKENQKELKLDETHQHLSYVNHINIVENKQ
jgi:hypothetical protein